MLKKEEINSVEAIFCQSFGPRENCPGISNEFLANIIVETYSKMPRKLIIQKDAADAFPKNIQIDKIISAHKDPGKYLDTYEVSRQCAEYCKANNITKLLIFAHPHQSWRVVKTIEKFGLECLCVDLCSMPYDPKSVQVWTRSPWAFIPREFIVRIAYFFTGKI